MPRYTVNWDYGSSLGSWGEGETIDLDADTADHVNRSSPGVLSPVDEQPEPEPRAVDEPPHDRMVRKANKRGGAS